MDYVEEKSFGMRTFKSLYKDYGLPFSKYEYKEHFLILTFALNMGALKLICKHPVVQQLNSEELIGYKWIKSLDEVTAKDYAMHFNVRTKFN